MPIRDSQIFVQRQTLFPETVPHMDSFYENQSAHRRELNSPGDVYAQGARGKVALLNGHAIVTLFQGADASTFCTKVG